MQTKIIDIKMNKISKIQLKKSQSLFTKNQTSQHINPQQISQTNISHVQEMIFQKYNFSHRIKTNSYQNHRNKYQSINKTALSPTSNVIVISQFPKISQSASINSKSTLFNNDKIQNTKQKVKQNSIDICDYQFVHSPIRQINQYKDCIKRIQMNTTYRGFNFTKDKFQNKKNRYLPNQKIDIDKNQDFIKTPFKAAQRKRIIHYIIQKGFAKKMENSLIKARNQKIKVHHQLTSVKNTKIISPIKNKRSVIFSQTESLPTQNIPIVNKLDGKQHLIEPW